MIFKKLRLKLYKQRKIREDKTPTNRYYYVSFKVKVDDPYNPHEFDREFNMVIPAKATFFAKKRIKTSILRKIDINFLEIERLTYEDWQEHERDKERFISEVNGRENGEGTEHPQ